MSLIFANDLCSAFTTAVVESFTEKFPNGYLGRTALQKLIYFSQVIGVPVPCSFEIYNFGPYSDEITKSVNRLLADDAIEDVSSSPSKYSSYRPGPSSKDFAPAFSNYVKGYREMIDVVVGALGSSSPTTLELVATLHFVNAKLKGFKARQPTSEEVKAEFRVIKGSKFAPSEIDRWYGWLGETGLL